MRETSSIKTTRKGAKDHADFLNFVSFDRSSIRLGALLAIQPLVYIVIIYANMHRLTF